MRPRLVAACGLVFALGAAAQTAGIWWGGKGRVEAAALARDAAGNLYIVGTTQSEDLAATGDVVDSFAAPAFPGVCAAHARLGAGRNVFQVSAGGLTRTVTITGEP